MKKIRGIVSGFYNPLHLGHIEYINASREQCDYLIVIVNSDKQVSLKKSRPFMDENHRKAIIDNLKSVDRTVIAIDDDKTVCQSLEAMRLQYPDDDLIFFNSGDRADINNTEIAELDTCKRCNIKYVAIPLPKIYSSSALIDAARSA